eukprot:scaffold323_cov232-Pinguiococcus_pyrenoidosus.AAC.19
MASGSNLRRGRGKATLFVSFSKQERSRPVWFTIQNGTQRSMRSAPDDSSRPTAAYTEMAPPL